MTLVGCSSSGEVERSTRVDDRGDLWNQRQIDKIERIKPTHDGDTIVITVPTRTPKAAEADSLVRRAIAACEDSDDCESTGVFILVGQRGRPQLRVGSKWATNALEQGLTYGPTYLRTQRKLASSSPLKQAKSLARDWSDAAAYQPKHFWFVDSLVKEAIGGLTAPSYDLESGVVARTQRSVSETTAHLFDRESGPIEAIVGFTAIGVAGRLLFRRWRGVSGSIARPLSAVVYATFAIPVSYGVIALLGYRLEDRSAYKFDRSNLAWLYDSNLWAPIDSWWVVIALGAASLTATALSYVPMFVVMMFAEDLKGTRLARDNWFILQVADTQADELFIQVLRSLALPIALLWAGHTFLPALIVYLLVIPAVATLPWTAWSAYRAVRTAKLWNQQLAARNSATAASTGGAQT